MATKKRSLKGSFRSPAGERRRAKPVVAPATEIKHNSYFDGQVQSVAFERHGRRATVGVIAPGEYHFGTGAPERMTIVSGELQAKPDGGSWSRYPAGTAFEIAGAGGFDVRAQQACAYLCEFL